MSDPGEAGGHDHAHPHEHPHDLTPPAPLSGAERGEDGSLLPLSAPERGLGGEVDPTPLLYVDCFSGISGDMLLGALLDAGLPFDTLQAELAKLDIGGYRLEAQPKQSY